MSIRQRVRAMFDKPERKITALNLELEELRQALYWASESRDPLTDIVHFFDIVSQWHDRGIDDLIEAFEEVNYGQYREVLEKLCALRTHFYNAGRHEHGWNRSKRGERVTDEKVFLGNTHGLWTKTVAYWKTTRNETTEVVNGKTAYEVVSRQARKFMNSHAFPMIAIIEDLQAIAA